VRIALRRQVTVPDPARSGAATIRDIVVEIFNAILLNDVALLRCMPGGVGIIFQVVGLLAKGHVAGGPTQIVRPASRTLADITGIGHRRGADDRIGAVGVGGGAQAQGRYDGCGKCHGQTDLFDFH